MKILVSACLLGINTRYDACNSLNEIIANLCKSHFLIPVCPEQLGGLSTPRLPVELVGGDGKGVILGEAFAKNCEGLDLSYNFIKGAKETLNIAKLYDCKFAILKAKSPSCGVNCIYDGTFSKVIKSGNGVTAQLLIENGIKVLNETDDLYYFLK